MHAIKVWMYAFNVIKQKLGLRMRGILSIPLGLAQLSAVAKECGYDTVHIPVMDKALKKRLSNKYLKKTIGREQFDMVLMACPSAESMQEIFRYAVIIKSINSSAPILLGGVYPSMSPEKFIECGEIDYIIRGEGEVALKEYLKSPTHENAKRIQGFCYKEQGTVHISEKFAQIPDLQSTPPFDLESMELDRYMKFNPFSNIQTARGCPYGCPFCLHTAFWGKETRFRPIKNIMHELQTLEKHGCTGGYIIDSSFTINRKRLQEFVEAYETCGLKMKIAVETRADLFDEEKAALLKRMNTFLVWFGGESGSAEVLDQLSGKDNSSNHVDSLFAAVSLCKKFDFISGTSWIAGLPNESKESLEATEKVILNLLDHGLTFADIRTLEVFSGTDYYDNPDEWGLQLNTVSTSEGWHSISHSTEKLSAKEINMLTERIRKKIFATYRKRSSLISSTSVAVDLYSWFLALKNRVRNCFSRSDRQ